jgi:hypothetical protein
VSQQNVSPLDQHRETIENWVLSGWSAAEVVRGLADMGLPTSDRSVRRALERWNTAQPESAGFLIDGDTAEVTSKPSTGYTNVEDLLVERGLAPEEWEVVSLTVNEWDSPDGMPLKQLKAHCRRKKAYDLIFPDLASIDFIHDRKYSTPQKGEGKLVVIPSDTHAPWHDTNLHSLFCDWLREFRPHEGVDLGDLLDFPNSSRHRKKPEWSASAKDCVNAGVPLLYDRVRASEGTRWKLMPGNHDDRLRNFIIEQNSDLIGFGPGDWPGEEPAPAFYDLRSMLQLERLGIEYIDPEGNYDQAQVAISPKLGARHGWLARPKAGVTALASLDAVGHSLVVGHTHRQAIVHHTTYDIDKNPEVLVAAEVGCMCRIDKGHGYAPNPNWQQGFMTALVFPDGTFNLERAVYVNNSLYYRDSKFL